MKLFARSISFASIIMISGTSLLAIDHTRSIASEGVFFRVPSGNIHCWANVEIGLDCEIQNNLAKLPPKPQDCNLDWGNRFRMSATGIAQRLCHGDTIGLDPKHRIIKYGTTWRGQGFSCVSRTSGLTCINQSGNGWNLSRNKQLIF